MMNFTHKKYVQIFVYRFYKYKLLYIEINYLYLCVRGRADDKNEKGESRCNKRRNKNILC